MEILIELGTGYNILNKKISECQQNLNAIFREPKKIINMDQLKMEKTLNTDKQQT